MVQVKYGGKIVIHPGGHLDIGEPNANIGGETDVEGATDGQIDESTTSPTSYDYCADSACGQDLINSGWSVFFEFGQLNRFQQSATAVIDSKVDAETHGWTTNCSSFSTPGHGSCQDLTSFYQSNEHNCHLKKALPQVGIVELMVAHTDIYQTTLAPGSSRFVLRDTSDKVLFESLPTTYPGAYLSCTVPGRTVPAENMTVVSFTVDTSTADGPIYAVFEEREVHIASAAYILMRNATA